jgi:RNA polymerase sigma-70 factor, ECF subfamily
MSELDEVTTHLRDAHAQFSALAAELRPSLHRYCARMTGSALDGEDLVQETLAQACYGLAMMREANVPLRPWLFTIAHHKCVDFLRARSRADALLDERNEPIMEIAGDIEDRDLASRAFSRLVLALPPRERAAIILKEVLECPLPEIAVILETSVGGVKSALHRGREKLSAAKDAPLRVDPPANVAGYVDAFNRRDWTQLQTLLEDEVRCELVGHVHHRGRDAVERNYFTNYGKLSYAWKLAAGAVDGEPAILCMREKDGGWVADHPIRVEWRGDRIARIRDYVHAPYVLQGATITVKS